MGPLVIREWLGRSNRRLAVVLTVLGLAAAVTIHHAEPAAAMGGMHGEHAMSAATMCAGTVVVGVAIVGMIAAALRPRRRPPRPATAAGIVRRLVPTGPLPRARSSPLYLEYAVLRR